MHAATQSRDVTLRQAALIAGFGLLVMGVLAPLAELFVYPELVIRGDIEATVANIQAQGGLYLAGFFAYLVVFILDIVVAWALYALLAPVNRPVSLLTAWMRLMYTAIAFYALFKLVSVYRLVNNPEFLAVFGPDQLHAQALLLLKSFRYEWSASLILFGIHLLMVGYLVYRSNYIPKIVGVIVGIAGLGWLVYEIAQFLLPGVDLGWLMITFFGELIFMAWLVIRGWKIPEPAS
jgi:hypothetical protein